MASILKHLRSSTIDKRPTASGLADGQIAINTASGSPGIFFKDNNSNVVKVGPVHVGAAAPNASPAGSAGNSLGELWVDNSLTTPGLNYYTGSAFVNLTPSGTTSTVGLVELATNAETQAGVDAVRAVTSAGLQSKVSDSISTTSSTTIASATAVKTTYDLANAALPKSGGTVTGEILISPSGSLVFEGSADDSFETTLAVVNPTADRTITLPNITGTVVTTGDTGSVTSTMIADGTIVNADINASAAIAPSKLGSGALPNGVTVSSTNIVDGTIVNADVNASAAIAGTKISPNFGGQNVVTTGSITGASLIPSSATVPTNGVYLPAANSVAISTNGTGRLFVGSSGNVGIGASSPGTKLEIVGGQNNVRSLRDTGTGGLTAADFGGGIAFGTSSAGSAAYLGANIQLSADQTWTAGTSHPSSLIFSTAPSGSITSSERLRITSDGKVGLGTSTPQAPLSISNGGANGIEIYSDYAGTGQSGIVSYNRSASQRTDLYISTDETIFVTSGSERCRLDASGRLLVGTSSARANFYNSTLSALFQQEGATSAGDPASRFMSLTYGKGNNDSGVFIFAKHRATTVGGQTVVVDGDSLGELNFQGSDGTEFVQAASIRAAVDGTPGANDMPGRLVFSTTADGSSGPTERMRIKSNGVINFSNVSVYADNAAAIAGGLAVGDVYRKSDGTLMIRY